MPGSYYLRGKKISCIKPKLLKSETSLRHKRMSIGVVYFTEICEEKVMLYECETIDDICAHTKWNDLSHTVVKFTILHVAIWDN